MHFVTLASVAFSAAAGVSAFVVPGLIDTVSADAAQPSTNYAPRDRLARATSSTVFTGGVATFFFQDGLAGACGTVNPDSALIVAIDSVRYGTPGSVSPLCGQQVEITNTNNGQTVTATIADDCVTCQNENSMDLSVGAFTAIASEEDGEVPITWQFV